MTPDKHFEKMGVSLFAFSAICVLGFSILAGPFYLTTKASSTTGKQKAMGSISGAVYYESDKKPVREFSVELKRSTKRNSEYDSVLAPMELMQHDQGRFFFANLHKGEYSIELQSKGMQNQCISGLTVSEETPHLKIDVFLSSKL